MIRTFIRIFFLPGFLACSAHGSGKTLVIQGSKESSLEFRSYVLSSPRHQSYARFQLLQRLNTPESKILKTRFADAQRSFHSDPPPVALEKFKSVVEMLHVGDWGPSERGVLHFALLRLAQLEPIQKKSDEWLKLAALMGWDIEPDQDLLPPPLLASYQDHLKNLVWQHISLRDHLDQFEFILIGGRSYSPFDHSVIRIPQGPHRWTVLSNSHEPSSQILESTNWSNILTHTRSLTQGSCSNISQLPPLPPEAKVHVFFSGGCVWKSEALPSPSLSSLTPLTPKTPGEPLSLSTDLPRPIYKKPWFWVGVGAGVTLTAIFILQQEKKRQERRQESATSYGF